jgi:hypothetical protein
VKVNRTGATRVALLAASSFSALALASPASAQSAGGNFGSDNQIITNNTVTPGTGSATTGANYANSPDVLSTGINGVGQMIAINLPFLNLCTGTLINPRTVITAAHCVYDHPKEFYGSNTGVGGGITPGNGLAVTNGIPISFGFESTNRCRGVTVNGCATNTGPYERWRDAGFQTVVSKHIYNGNQVWYGTGAQPVALGGGGEFANEDIALVTLDTHVKDVPTWTLLFSPLDGPTHVTITGYGNAGVGTSGIGNLAGIDYRRRSAENMIDALMSSNDWVDSPAIDPGDTAYADETHVMYWMDFDDPHFTVDGALANPKFFAGGRTGYYDFNGLGGVTLPHEGTTGGGDSGGPLIVDQRWDRSVLAGVLTGSWSFDGGAGLYGEFSVYPPLFQYWEEIVQNNPYKYASALTGNGDWFDPTHWVQDMDPNYVTIGADGQLVNLLPDTHQGGADGAVDKFGTLCFLGESCTTFDGPGFPTGDGTPVTTAGGPGSTNFVPNNVEPVNSTDPSLYKKARYYDVTLGRAGTTTLSGNATIDKLTIDGAAKLDIAAGGSLKVWAEFNQASGWTNVDGSLTTSEAVVGTGLLSGKGTFDPTFLTVIGGAVAPGGGDKVGTLTVKSDMIIASASSLFIDAQRGSADQLKVIGDSDGTGILTLSAGTGGAKPSVVFNKVTNAPAPRDGESYVIASGAGGVTGTFGSVYTFQGVLRPQLTYSANAVTATLRAGSLVTILSGQNATAIAFANALDQLRNGYYDKLSNLYGNVDWMNGAQLNATFNALSPSVYGETQLLQDRQSRQLLGNIGDRLSLLGTGQASGFSFSGTPMAAMAGSEGTAQAVMNLQGGGKPVTIPVAGGLSGFAVVSADSVRSSYGGSHGIDAGQHSRYFASGVEAPFGDVMIGTAVGYAETLSNAGSDGTRSKLTQAAAYASKPIGHGAYLGAVIAADLASSNSNRMSTDTVSSFRLSGATHSSRYTATAEAGFRTGIGHGLSLNPRAQIGVSHLAVGGFHELGGETALELNNLKVNRVESRIGARLDGTTKVAGWTVSPQIQADYVRLVSGRNNGLSVSFAAAPDYDFVLPLTNGGSGWVEMKGGVEMTRGSFSLGLTGQATAGSAPISDKRGLVRASFRF